MKWLGIALILAVSVLATGPARANADDMKWIAQCMKDNSDAKVAPDVVSKYCTCMNDKMSDNETQSITKWEKTHPKEEAECDKQAGWK